MCIRVLSCLFLVISFFFIRGLNKLYNLLYNVYKNRFIIPEQWIHRVIHMALESWSTTSYDKSIMKIDNKKKQKKQYSHYYHSLQYRQFDLAKRHACMIQLFIYQMSIQVHVCTISTRRSIIHDAFTGCPFKHKSEFINVYFVLWMRNY